MKFCTVINCIDGRVQLPVISYLQERFNAEFVDSITHPGPGKLISEQRDNDLIESILGKVQISVEKHKSSSLAIVAHHDCLGNPIPDEEQMRQVQKAARLLKVKLLREHTAIKEVIGLWVDQNWQVHELDPI